MWNANRSFANATPLVTRLSRYIPLAIVLLLAIWPSLLSLIFSDYPSKLVPTALDQTCGFLAVLFLMRVKSPPLLVSGYFWIVWYFIGSLNVISSSLSLGSYYSNLDITGAARIYLAGCLAYVLGLLASDRLWLSKLGKAEIITPQMFPMRAISGVVLLIFPIVWLGSLYLTLRYIPILSGRDITDEIYEQQYGALYPYTVLLVLSYLYVLHLQLTNRLMRGGLLYLLLILLVSFADGRRVVAMISLFATVPLVFRYYGNKAWNYMSLVIIVLAFLYIGTMFARQGWVSDRYVDDWITRFIPVGVEFRDFVFSVNNYSPGQVPGYSWFVSGLAAMGNNWVLDLVGINKGELVRMGSAYVWSDLLRSPFGIRTGLVSEVWFAYGLFGFGVLFVVGAVTGYFVKRINQARSEFSLLFWSGTFGLLLTAVVGQTTAITGSFVVFLYVYVAVLVERMVFRARRYRKVGMTDTTRIHQAGVTPSK